MPITYNPDTDTIAVTGFTQENPCSFEDIYQADVSSGWGVTEKKETAYFIDAIIQIGNSEDDSWLADKAKQLFFYADCAFKNSFRTGHLILGEIENEEEKTTRNGCYVECHGFHFIRSNIREIDLLDTKVVSKRTYFSSYLRVGNSTGKIWNSELHGIVMTEYATLLDIYNAELGNFPQDASFAPFRSFSVGNGAMEKITVANSVHAATHYFLSGIAVKNLTARNIGNALLFLYHAKGESLADDWDVDWSGPVLEGTTFGEFRFWRRYSVNFRVQDEKDNPIPGAQVTLKDINGDTVYSAVTDETGRTPIQVLSWGYYNPDGAFPSTPHTLTVTKQGYQKYETKIALDRKLIDFPVVLKKEYINPDQEVLS